MTDYRELSNFEKNKIDINLLEQIDPKEILANKYNKFDYIKNGIHKGDICAECWMIFYNCLCSHD